MLCYTQCCDVNQPLQPLVPAIPTLGRLQPAAQDTAIPSWAFLGASWGRAEPREQSAGGVLWQHPALVGVPCASTPRESHHRLGLCTSASCTQLLNSASENLSFWNFSSPWNIPSKLPESPAAIPAGHPSAGLLQLSPNSCSYKVPVSLL